MDEGLSKSGRERAQNNQVTAAGAGGEPYVLSSIPCNNA